MMSGGLLGGPAAATKAAGAPIVEWSAAGQTFTFPSPAGVAVEQEISSTATPANTSRAGPQSSQLSGK